MQRPRRYLSQIQDYDDSVAGRVKGLRDEARRRSSGWPGCAAQIKGARDAIAVKEREVAATRQRPRPASPS